MLNDNDRKLIDKIVAHFRDNGIIRDESDDSFTPIGTTQEILNEAYELAKYEKELNPNFYNEDVSKSLDDIEDTSFNPMIDDYWEN